MFHGAMLIAYDCIYVDPELVAYLSLTFTLSLFLICLHPNLLRIMMSIRCDEDQIFYYAVVSQSVVEDRAELPHDTCLYPVFVRRA
jgi:hypothetical protein